MVVPDDPVDEIAPIDGIYDGPSRVDEQLGWLAAAGFTPAVAWTQRDLAVLVADR